MTVWLLRYWNDIKGNVKYAVALIIGTAIVTGVVALTHGLCLWQQVVLAGCFVLLFGWALMATMAAFCVSKIARVVPCDAGRQETIAPGLSVEEDEAPRALNLIFRSKTESSEVILTITDMQKWNVAERDFEVMQLRGARQPSFLGGEEFRYQIMTWPPEGNPVIKGVEDKLWTLPSAGVWRVDLEYRSGAPIRFSRYVEWDGRAKPFYTRPR